MKNLRARENIDRLLTGAGWIVQDKRSTNLSAGRGVAVREFPLKSGHGEADYLLFVDGAPIGAELLDSLDAANPGGQLGTEQASVGPHCGSANIEQCWSVFNAIKPKKSA